MVAIFAAPHTDLAESALRAIRFALMFFALLLGIRAAFNRIILGIASYQRSTPLPLFSPDPHQAFSSILRC
jgi:hypothetical protein